MDTGKLKKFAQKARLQLMEQIGSRLDQVLHSDSVELRERSAAVKELKGQMVRLEKLAAHSPELCKQGKHITESYATGGRSGHCVTRCLVCDYRQDGYD